MLDQAVLIMFNVPAGSFVRGLIGSVFVNLWLQGQVEPRAQGAAVPQFTIESGLNHSDDKHKSSSLNYFQMDY